MTLPYSWPWIDEHRLTCGQCGLSRRQGDDPDPCIGRLPGVAQACCGHGGDGYLIFENGVVLGPLPREQFGRVKGPKAFDVASANAYAAKTGKPLTGDVVEEEEEAEGSVMTTTCANTVNDIRLRSLDSLEQEGAHTVAVCNRIAADESRTREDRMRLIEIERERFLTWAQGLRELVEESIEDVEAFWAWKAKP